MRPASDGLGYLVLSCFYTISSSLKMARLSQCVSLREGFGIALRRWEAFFLFYTSGGYRWREREMIERKQTVVSFFYLIYAPDEIVARQPPWPDGIIILSFQTKSLRLSYLTVKIVSNLCHCVAHLKPSLSSHSILSCKAPECSDALELSSNQKKQKAQKNKSPVFPTILKNFPQNTKNQEPHFIPVGGKRIKTLSGKVWVFHTSACL